MSRMYSCICIRSCTSIVAHVAEALVAVRARRFQREVHMLSTRVSFIGSQGVSGGNVCVLQEKGTVGGGAKVSMG